MSLFKSSLENIMRQETKCTQAFNKVLLIKIFLKIIRRITCLANFKLYPLGVA